MTKLCRKEGGATRGVTLTGADPQTGLLFTGAQTILDPQQLRRSRAFEIPRNSIVEKTSLPKGKAIYLPKIGKLCSGEEIP